MASEISSSAHRGEPALEQPRFQSLIIQYDAILITISPVLSHNAASSDADYHRWTVDSSRLLCSGWSGWRWPAATVTALHLDAASSEQRWPTLPGSHSGGDCSLSESTSMLNVIDHLTQVSRLCDVCLEVRRAHSNIYNTVTSSRKQSNNTDIHRCMQ